MKVIFAWMVLVFTLHAEIDPSTILVRSNGSEDAFHRKMGAEFKKLPKLKWTVVKLKEHGHIKDYEQAGLFEWVSPNYTYSAIREPVDPFYPQQYCHQIMKSEPAWDKITSNNVVVAIIDSGIDFNHPDLRENLWTGPSGEHGYTCINTVQPGGQDDYFHGTHVAGIVGAVGNNTLGVCGVNWRVKLLSMKFLSHFGTGTSADAMLALDKLIELKENEVNVRVCNNSWGGTSKFRDLALEEAFKEVEAAGILIVCAAGNGNANNDDANFSPASLNVDGIVSVPASGATDNRAGFSNYGLAHSDIFAPGEAILSTEMGGSYQILSGTSMASPQIAGAAAMLFALNLNLTPLHVKQILLDPASFDRINFALTSTGGGRVNLWKLVNNPLINNPTPTNRPPGAVLSPNTNLVLVVANQSVPITVIGTDQDQDILSYYVSWKSPAYSDFVRRMVGGESFNSDYIANNRLVVTAKNMALDQALNIRFAVNDRRGGTTLRTTTAWAYRNTNLVQNLAAFIHGFVITNDASGWPWFRLDIKPSYPYLDSVRFELKIVGGDFNSSFGSNCCFRANVSHKASAFIATKGSYTFRAVAADQHGNLATAPEAVYYVNNSVLRPPSIRISYNTKRGPAPLKIIADMSATLPGDAMKLYYRSTRTVDEKDLSNPIREVILTEPGVYDFGFVVRDEFQPLADIIHDVFTVLPPELPPIPPAPVLTPPQNLTAFHSGGQMQLEWVETAIGEDRVVLEQSTKEKGPWTPWLSLVTLPPNTKRYGFATSGGNYQFRGRTCASTNCGLFSNVATIRVR